MFPDPDTLYHATASSAGFSDALPAECETLVIGGGLAGLTTAERLAEADHNVVLIEARRIGHGASGRNGGFVSPGFAEGMDAVAARVGLDDAKVLYALSHAGFDHVAHMINVMDVDDVVQGRRGLKVVRYDDNGGLRRHLESRHRDYGVTGEYLGREPLFNLLKTDRYFAGVRSETAFQIHPLRYARALAAKARRHGAIIREQCPAQSIQRIGANWHVETADGIVVAKSVVLAVSAYGQGLWRPLDRAILPVATYVVASDPSEALLDEATRFDGSISDDRRAGDYYRRVPGEGGTRLLWGGRITTRTTIPPRLKEGMARDIASVYPQLEGLHLSHCWSGLMGYSRLKMPIIGALDEDLWACTAFGGHGLNTTAMGGKLVADAILHGDDEWRRLLPFHTRWGGGWPGRIAAQGAYWLMQARDRFDEISAGRAGP